MRRRLMLLALLIAASVTASQRLQAVDRDVVELLSRASADNQTNAVIAISELRAGGPARLDSLFEIRELLATHDKQVIFGLKFGLKIDKAAATKIDEVIDQVGAQKYCTASRLYWYTDLESAQREASKSGKPILSLRMLGKLTEDLSCANSRFFRTMLYANAEISEYLRNHFVLHWESVRPVPKVTIDFGNGRKLECTLGGNSVHYILASDGRPIDALPGLFGPAMFIERLREAEATANAYMRNDPSQRRTLLREYHQQRLCAVARAWQTDLVKVAGALPAVDKPMSQDAAELRDVAKALGGLAKGADDPSWFRVAVSAIEALDEATDGRRWKKIAELHPTYAELDVASLKLIRSQSPSEAAVGLTSVGATPNPTSNLDIDFRKGGFRSRSSEDTVPKFILDSFQMSIAMDTVRNEYSRHSRLHLCLFDDDRGALDVNVLNRWVYKELFSAPVDDPWVGLISGDVYPALKNGGIVGATSQPARTQSQPK